jgi:hypothetical protein
MQVAQSAYSRCGPVRQLSRALSTARRRFILITRLRERLSLSASVLPSPSCTATVADYGVCEHRADLLYMVKPASEEGSLAMPLSLIWLLLYGAHLSTPHRGCIESVCCRPVEML